METALSTLAQRNPPLFYFGLACLLGAGACLLLLRFTTARVTGVNAWWKPFKFFVSVGVFAWTMGWYVGYLGPTAGVAAYAWAVVGLLGFEVVYIAWQAGRGQLSHYNRSTPLYAGLYQLMAVAAVAVALWTAYIGLLFFRRDFPELPLAYVWGIRLGIVLFVVFALEGLVMGDRLAHSVGGPDGGPGLPVVHWSTRYGDARVAHFVGMHALQVLPLLACYVLRNVGLTVAVALLYALVAGAVLVQALHGRPLVAQVSRRHAADG